MMATTGALLWVLAVLCVILEATRPALVFGAIGFWILSHAT